MPVSMQVIKKYANRKLYHTNRKQYITLEGVAHIIQAGMPVQVIDNETGADITDATLAQIALQIRGRNGSILPTNVLTNIIRFSSDTLASLQQGLLASLSSQDAVDAEIKHRLRQLVAEGAMEQEEATRLQHLLLKQDSAIRVQDTSKWLPAIIMNLREGKELNIPFSNRNDVLRLHKQVDALVAEVERILEQRANDHEYEQSPEHKP